MPLSGCRATFFYNAPPYGFSETHVCTTASSITAAINNAYQLAKLRMLLCGPPCTFAYARLSMEGVFRDSQVFTPAEWVVPPPPPVSMAGGGVPTEPNDADQGKACILLRLNAGDSRRSSLYLAGIPDPIIGTDPQGPRAQQYAAWLTLFNNWMNYLLNNNWGAIYRTLPAGAFQQVPVVGVVTQALTNWIGVVVPTNVLTFTVGQSVQLTGFRMSNRAYFPLNGKWTISSVTANSPVAGQNTYYLYNSQTVSADTVTNILNARIQLIDYSPYNYTTVQILNQTTRKRGNRSLVGPGRRKVQKYITA
jgi:hypothetical protein